MDNAFYTEGVTNYDQALQEYANELNNKAITQASIDKPIDEYNEKLTGVSEPIGVALLDKPLLKTAKRGVEKLLGKTAKSAVKAGRQAARSALEGDLRGAGRALTQPLRDAQSQLGEIAGRVRVQAVDLSDSSRGAVNSLRAGRNIRPAAPELSTPKPAGAGAINDPIVPKANAPIFEEPPVGGAAGDIPPPPSITAPGFAEAPIDPRFVARTQITTADRPTEIDAGDPFSQPRTLSSRIVTPKEAGAVDEEADSTLSSALRNASKSVSKATAQQIAGGSERTAAETTLGALSEGADDFAAAQGGGDVAADVVAGALGLGSLLSGIFGGKAEPELHTPEFIPSAQFGI
jgi:hypothetical protein